MAEACTICGDTEPSHVHHEGQRIEGYFTVGRGETDFQAAERWKREAAALRTRLEAVEGALEKQRANLVAFRAGATDRYPGLVQFANNCIAELDAARTPAMTRPCCVVGEWLWHRRTEDGKHLVHPAGSPELDCSPDLLPLGDVLAEHVREAYPFGAWRLAPQTEAWMPRSEPPGPGSGIIGTYWEERGCYLALEALLTKAREAGEGECGRCKGGWITSLKTRLSGTHLGVNRPCDCSNGKVEVKVCEKHRDALFGHRCRLCCGEDGDPAFDPKPPTLSPEALPDKARAFVGEYLPAPVAA